MLTCRCLFTDSDQTFGHRRVHGVPGRLGERCSPELGMVACQPCPWRPTTAVAGDTAPIPDLVARGLPCRRAGTELVNDITCLPTWEGFAYR